MSAHDLLFLGIKSHVVAFEKNTGREIWRTQLKSGLSLGDRFVVLLAETDHLFAQTKGELLCLNPLSGELLWHNPLTGLSYDLASLATTDNSVVPAVARKKRDAGSTSQNQSSTTQVY